MQPLQELRKSVTSIETDLRALKNESDVEQKLVFPLFVGGSYLNYSSAWVLTKKFIAAANIGKGAKRRTGYIPDYLITIDGFPILVCEAKSTDIDNSVGLEEGFLYAADINSRYPWSGYVRHLPGSQNQTGCPGAHVRIQLAQHQIVLDPRWWSYRWQKLAIHQCRWRRCPVG